MENFFRIFSLLLALIPQLVMSQNGNFPPDFFDTRFSGGFQAPIDLTVDDRGNLYVTEHGGKVWVVDTLGVRYPEPLVDISEEVTNWHDHGLTSMVLDRDFYGNGYFYLLYTVDPYWDAYHDQPNYLPDSTITNAACWGRVTRYTADPATDFKTVIPGSRKVLLGTTPLDGVPIFYNFHGLGKIHQADDQTLLISVGDGSDNGTDIGGPLENSFVQDAISLGYMTADQDVGSYRSQYLGSLQGKILRIDPETGDGLPSNPFYQADQSRSPISRIWAMGLRNPFNFTLIPNTGSHDPATGDVGRMYIGDVGNGAWEELNICEAAGQNFGWPHYEGATLNWAFQNAEQVANQLAPNPLAANGCPEFLTFRQTYIPLLRDEATVLTNPCSPSEVYAYTGTAKITPPALTWSNANWNLPWRSGTQYFSGDQGYADFLPMDHPESPIEGEMFGGYSSLAGVIPSFPNWPPAYRDKLFFFDYSGWIKMATLDEFGRPTRIEPFVDNSRMYGLEANAVTGNLYYITHSSEVRQISFGGNPPPVAVAEATPRFGGNTLTVNFDALASTDQNDATEDLSFFWDFGDGSFSETSQVQHQFQGSNQGPESFMVRLRVTDPEGATAWDSLIISLNNTPPEAEITSFQNQDRYPTNQTNLLELTAVASDAEHATEDLTIEWQTYLHHNDHFHPDPVETSNQSRIFLEPLGCSGDELYYFRVRLKVTDPEGLFTEIEQVLEPNCAEDLLVATELTALSEEEYVDLNWNYENLSSSDLVHLEIQRGTDFLTFRPVHVFADVTTAPFNWRDNTPNEGNNVYRIKTITADRTINYSNMATASWASPPSVLLSPNPSDGPVRLAYNQAFPGGQLHFEFYDVSGKRIGHINWFAAESDWGFIKDFTFEQLPAGSYFYRLTGPNLDHAGSFHLRK
ncbi:MAG: PQQ-dependent sugar dehydrogenase [Bacteroidota bacterium]